MNRLFHAAPLGIVSWLRLVAVAVAGLAITELENGSGSAVAGAGTPCLNKGARFPELFHLFLPDREH
jgi:hypothetical protein